MRRLTRIHGIIDRVTAGVAAVVPWSGGREIYFRADTIPDAREGLEIKVLARLADDPNGLAEIVVARPRRPPRPARMASFPGLVRQLARVREKLQARRDELAAIGDVGRAVEDEIAALDERLAWLARGRDLFGG